MPQAPAYAALRRDIAAGHTILIDGATGTELERRGAVMHDRSWCAMATLSAPQLLGQIHQDYIRAGARVIIANTFSSNRLMLEPAGLGEHFDVLNRRAVEIALAARETADPVARTVVAASMSHQLPAGARPETELAAGHFHELAALLAASGAELIVLEMMSRPEYARPALAAAQATGLPVWVGFSVTADDTGAPVSYGHPQLPAAALFESLALDGVDAAGVMHSKAELTGPALELLRERWTGPLLAYPDSGYFKMPHWQFVDIMPVEEFVAFNRGWIDSGVQIVGGCCGLGVEHIRGLAAVC